MENDKEIQEFALNEFYKWIDTFKGEDIPENRRITDYRKSTVGRYDTTPEKTEIYIQFYVTPFNKDNTEWEYSEPTIVEYRGHKIIDQKKNTCFIEILNNNGEYKIDYISEKPRNYDKFLERFEQYKKENVQKEETVQVQGQNTTINLLQNQKIEKMGNMISITCILVLAVTGIIIVSKFVKKKSCKFM